MINFLEITEECETILSVLFFARELLKIVCILIPIGLIVMLTIDIGKGVISGEEKSGKIINIVIKRLIYAVVIFLLPETVFGLFNILLVNQTDDSYACWKFAGEASVEDVRTLMAAQEEALAKQMEEINKELQRQNEEKVEKINIFQKTVLTLANKTGSSDGSFLGQTYDLTDEELRGIAMQCQKEQGNAKGAAAEASLMANRFELFPNEKYPDLYSYVKNVGWWANSKKNMSDTSSLKQEVLDTVKEVLVLGKRTLPLYVNEHDCIWCGDKYGYNVDYIDNNGKIITNDDATAILERSNYIKDVTKIYNTYNSVYTFHCFVSDSKYADPFGYTDKAMKKYKELQGLE